MDERVLWIAMQRLKDAFLQGHPSPFSDTEISALLTFELHTVYGLSPTAVDELTSHYHPLQRYLIGLGVAHMAIETSDAALADTAACLMIYSAEQVAVLDGPDLTQIIQRLATLRRNIA